MGGHAHHDEGFIKKYLWSTDHKIIAMQYLFTGMAMALIGGFAVYVFRMQLAFPGASVPLFGRVSAGQYNALVTNHGTIMIFLGVVPLGAYVVAHLWTNLYSLGGAEFFLRDEAWASTLPYVAPTAFAPLIVAILIDAGSGIFMALFVSIFTGVIYGNRLDLLVLLAFEPLREALAWAQRREQVVVLEQAG